MFCCPSLWFAALAATACASSAGVREHDAMVAALRGLDREVAAGAADDRAGDAAGDAAALAALGSPLDRAALVAAVLARNPDAEAARQSWRAAVAAYPGAVALADPMVGYELAPLSITGDAPFGQRVELRQRLAFPGKRDRAGAAALADADVARAAYAQLRLGLAEAAVMAFDDAYTAARAIEVNLHHREMVEQIAASARAQYSAGRAGQQDVLEAEGELIALAREQLGLETERRAAAARINRLLHRPPDAPLPPLPARLAIATPGSAAAREPAAADPGAARGPAVAPARAPPAVDGAATAADPTAAAAARVRARSAELAVAERAAYPDVELMAAYDSMFEDRHQLTLGIAVEIPLERRGRRGAIERAQAGLAAAAAELASVRDALAEDAARARQEVAQASAEMALYEQRAVPNAQARVASALAGFRAGQVAFASVLAAERALRELELGAERARANLDRRTAALDRLSGRIAGGTRNATAGVSAARHGGAP